MSVLPVDSLEARFARQVFSPLARLRRRCRLYLALEGLVRLTLVVVAAGGGQLLLDRGLRLAVDQRAVLSAGLTLLWLWMLYRYVLASLLRPLSDRALALAVDRAHPELCDQIASAVQFARGQIGAAAANSRQLAEAVIGDACRMAPGIPFMGVLNHRRARQRAIELAGLILAATVTLAAKPGLSGPWIRRNWLLQEVPWPQQTYITPIGFDQSGRRRVPRGDELEIAALNRGRVPKSAVVRWSTSSGRGGSEPMTLIGANRWEAELGRLTENVSFRIVGGDERTRQYTVQAIDRPRVLGTVARITPPEYTGLAPVALEQQTVLELFRDSVLELEVQLNRPVASAGFVGSGGAVAPCERLADDRLRVRWDGPVSGSYFFELVDRDGWTNQRPVNYVLKVLPDPPPDVRVEMPGVGESITPAAQLPIDLRFEDNFGLAGVGLQVQRADDPPFDVPLDRFTPGQREFADEVLFAIATTGAAAGDAVRLWAEARDRDPHGPNVGRSGVVEMRVLVASDFLTELTARELELRREFERLISAQRGLKDAIERLLPDLPDRGAAPVDISQRLAGLARRQDAHAQNCRVISRRFGQILDEMRVNRVARVEDECRIGERIVMPLERLGRESMPASSTVLVALRSEATSAGLEALPRQQAGILRQMQAVLANILESEGYREAVALLEEIISLQSEVRAATIETLDQELREILDLEEPLETAPEETPEP